ncbi:unnamed protein product [Prorocentrum cordatum]|uniref:Autophagy-related protein 9 n=1 Tax=Prorocentrum cordatum TaxID=2364126 RepID=A0ABN9TMM2_9DINO|nr:unnamed protein product [Polarella glacialis]
MSSARPLAPTAPPPPGGSLDRWGRGSSAGRQPAPPAAPAAPLGGAEGLSEASRWLGGPARGPRGGARAPAGRAGGRPPPPEAPAAPKPERVESKGSSGGGTVDEAKPMEALRDRLVDWTIVFSERFELCVFLREIVGQMTFSAFGPLGIPLLRLYLVLAPWKIARCRFRRSRITRGESTLYCWP